MNDWLSTLGENEKEKLKSIDLDNLIEKLFIDDKANERRERRNKIKKDRDNEKKNNDNSKDSSKYIWLWVNLKEFLNKHLLVYEDDSTNVNFQPISDEKVEEIDAEDDNDSIGLKVKILIPVFLFSNLNLIKICLSKNRTQILKMMSFNFYF